MRADVSSLAFRLDRLATPIGTLFIMTDADGKLRAVDFHDYESRMLKLLRQQYRYVGAVTLSNGEAPKTIRRAIEAYFSGEFTAIDPLPVETAGTAFQRTVWRALRGIPAGTTTSYGKLACAIGAPAAVRAVGLANGANPVGIVVPCHRVIGADSSLTGYGGGLPRKHWLLTHEGAVFKSSAKDSAARLPGL